MSRNMVVLAILLQVVPAGAAELVSKAEPLCASAGLSSSANIRALSADGRFVAFESWATNLVPGQNTRGKTNVYLRDMASGTTALVSHKTGEPATGGSSGSDNPLVSADGGLVVFQSTANDLIYEQLDSLGTDDLFIWDRATGVTTLVTQEAGSPGMAVGGSLYYVLLSEDARYVAYANSALNLVPGQVDTNDDLDIFLYDRVSGSTALVSHTPASPATAGSSYAVPQSLSADGRYLVFWSPATNLAPGGQTGFFLYDRVSGAVTHIASGSGSASISADGSFIAVGSTANLTAGQTDPQSVADVYLYNRQAGTFTLVSHASSAALASANGASGEPILSPDGRYVAYESDASNLVPGQTAGPGGQLFLYDRITGTSVLVSHASGSPATPSDQHQIDGPVFSADGRYVAFMSTAANLIPGQTGTSFGNVFLYDRTTGAMTMPSHAQGSPQQAAGRASTDISLSADGRWVAFGSYSSAIDPADCNSQDDVFLHDRVAGTNELVSEHDPGAPSLAASGLLGPGSASDDGRFAVFQSGAINLAAGITDGNDETDVFLHDRSTGSNTLVSGSASSPGTTADGRSVEPRISGDGRWVVFVSEAADLVPGQTDSGWFNAFLYDRVTGSRALVDHVSSSPVQAPQNSFVNDLGISASGRYVSFSSTAGNLVAGQVDDGSSPGVFVFDRLTGANQLVSRAAGSTVQAVSGWDSAISADGRYVAFVSSAHNLVAGPVEFPNESWHIYLHDRSTGTTSLVSRAGSPAARAANASSSLPALSADGRFVTFLSYATDLVPGQSDANGAEDVFLYDRVLGTLSLVSHVPGAPATAGNGAASAPALSPEGTYVAFESRSTNLVAGQQDPNAERDIFLYDRRTGAVALVSHAEGLPARAGQYVSTRPAVSADGTVAYQSAAQNLTSGSDDVRQPQVNAYLYDPRTGTNRLLSGASVQDPGFTFTTFTTVAISRNGRSAWFDTEEGDVVPGDHNSAEDVFVDQTPPPASDFHTVTPCRLLDTRMPGYGPALASDAVRLLAVHGSCGIPPAARALVVNVTALGATGSGSLVLHPGGVAVAESTTVSFNAGGIRSNNAIAVLTPGVERGLAVTPTVAGGGTVHLILDVSGWFE